MSTVRIAISLDKKVLKTIDQLVKRKLFTSRNQFIREAIQERFIWPGRSRLARECAKLDVPSEQAIADEG